MDDAPRPVRIDELTTHELLAVIKALLDASGLELTRESKWNGSELIIRQKQ